MSERKQIKIIQQKHINEKIDVKKHLTTKKTWKDDMDPFDDLDNQASDEEIKSILFNTHKTDNDYTIVGERSVVNSSFVSQFNRQIPNKKRYSWKL